MSQTTVLSAHEIAEALQARLTLLHVRSSIHIPFGEAVEAPAAVDVSKLLEEVPRGPIEPVVHVREGMVVNEILAECEEGHFDLLVLGQHLMDRATGGPLSENLAEVLVMECPIPVLVVRPRRWAAQTAAGQSGSEAPGS